MLSLELSNNKVFAADQSSKDVLKKGSFGYESGGKLYLYPEETLYVMDVRNAECKSKGKVVSFEEMVGKFTKSKKFMTKYFTYKDWRDRGLIAKRAEFEYKSAERPLAKKYPADVMQIPKYKVHGIFFSNDLVTVADGTDSAKKLYEDFWFGQFGSYKAADRGKLNKFDAYETVFLMEKKILSLRNATKKDVIKHATARRHDFGKLYEAYKDWREKGYVVKTGFKFGTHFRIYFPGAKPVNNGNEWIHSKHVIHIFPKESRLLISEWARAIRVAHSVRKTFILVMPGKAGKGNVKMDYVLYHRKGGEVEDPETDPPKYAMLSLNEEEYIGGRELTTALKDARERKLELIIAIADRETAVTYYKVRQIELPRSDHEYYEIDWIQP